ncbi:MAG TPA: tetratricopeptide repeat protein [Vitreimonas sp.]|uniref:tetratricopeptide repeat protein n=1 Tax=Vitreimonas sp. TaxID=3069702 RepID=UPI002D2B2F62|nr:tetratricopeptide repeat protein [Vitreimonas sp.]HYD87202.1 tetratricopeptide repeat protein [Vitreimonas sp.]
MKRWVLALIVLALAAACERQAQVATPAAECDTLRDREARIAACTTAAEDETYSADVRAAALATRARLREDAGEVTPALRDYEAALRLDENNAGAALGRGRILLESGQLDAAEPLLLRAKRGGEGAEASALLGQIALRRSRFDEAVTEFDAALAANSRNAAALSGRARAKHRMGDLDGAAADYDAAVRADGALAEARAGRCWLDLNEERNFTRARGDADAAVAADPRNVEAQLCRGVLQLREGEWADARASFEAALEVEPGNPTALFGRGVARRRSGDNDGRADMNLARDFDRHIGQRFDDMGVETY